MWRAIARTLLSYQCKDKAISAQTIRSPVHTCVRFVDCVSRGSRHPVLPACRLAAACRWSPGSAVCVSFATPPSEGTPCRPPPPGNLLPRHPRRRLAGSPTRPTSPTHRPIPRRAVKIGRDSCATRMVCFRTTKV